MYNSVYIYVFLRGGIHLDAENELEGCYLKETEQDYQVKRSCGNRLEIEYLYLHMQNNTNQHQLATAVCTTRDLVSNPTCTLGLWNSSNGKGGNMALWNSLKGLSFPVY